jgi:hypothetical protein
VKSMTGKNTPLRVTVKRNVLTIEIGVETLAHCALRSPFAYELMGPEQHRPDTKYAIVNSGAFAHDVRRSLLDEAEDGSSLLTNVLDAAIRDAIEEGSEWFVKRKDIDREALK